VVERLSSAIEMARAFERDRGRLHAAESLNRQLVEQQQKLGREFSERLSAQESLVTEQEHLQLAVEASRTALWEYDAVNDRFSYHPTALRFLKLTREDLDANLQHTIDSISDPVQRAEAVAAFERLTSGECDEIDLVWKGTIKRDGPAIWQHIRGKVLERGPDRRPVRVAGSFTDITSLKEREKELECLSFAARVIATPDLDLGEALSRIVALIPPAFFHTDIAAARLHCGEVDVQTDNFVVSPWLLTAHAAGHQQHVCILQVAYLEERPQLDRGPFLHEEQHLLNALAQLAGGLLRLRLESPAGKPGS
jgi:PAS domain-containing protein